MKRNAFFIVTLGQFSFFARAVNGAVLNVVRSMKTRRTKKTSSSLLFLQNRETRVEL